MVKLIKKLKKINWKNGISALKYTLKYNLFKEMKIIKYFFVGAAAAITDILLFYIFAKLLGYNYLIVAFFSFIIATFVNYILSIKYVFKSGISFSKKKEISLIYVISGIALIINQVSLYILIDLITVEMTLSKVIATIITFFWNYFIRKNYIFKENTT